MMQEFHLHLKNDKTVLYSRMTLLFMLLNTGLLTYILILTNSSTDQYILSGAIVAVVITGILIPSKKGNSILSNRLRLIATLIITSAWIFTGNWVIAAICVTLGLLQWVSVRPLVVEINDNIIKYPSWPEKIFNWKEMDVVILKDGFLTMNFRQGKYIQQYVEESNVDEKEFNEFCRIQISK